MKRNILIISMFIASLIGISYINLNAAAQLHFGDWVTVKNASTINSYYLSDNAGNNDIRADTDTVTNTEKWQLIDPNDPASTAFVNCFSMIALKSSRNTYLSWTQGSYYDVKAASTTISNSTKWKVFDTSQNASSPLVDGAGGVYLNGPVYPKFNYYLTMSDKKDPVNTLASASYKATNWILTKTEPPSNNTQLHFSDWITLKSAFGNYLCDKLEKNLPIADTTTVTNTEKWQLIDPNDPASTAGIISSNVIILKSSRNTYLTWNDANVNVTTQNAAITNYSQWTMLKNVINLPDVSTGKLTQVRQDSFSPIDDKGIVYIKSEWGTPKANHYLQCGADKTEPVIAASDLARGWQAWTLEKTEAPPAPQVQPIVQITAPATTTPVATTVVTTPVTTAAVTPTPATTTPVVITTPIITAATTTPIVTTAATITTPVTAVQTTTAATTTTPVTTAAVTTPPTITIPAVTAVTTVTQGATAQPAGAPTPRGHKGKYETQTTQVQQQTPAQPQARAQQQVYGGGYSGSYSARFRTQPSTTPATQPSQQPSTPVNATTGITPRSQPAESRSQPADLGPIGAGMGTPTFATYLAMAVNQMNDILARSATDSVRVTYFQTVVGLAVQSAASDNDRIALQNSLLTPLSNSKKLTPAEKTQIDGFIAALTTKATASGTTAPAAKQQG